MKKVIRFLLLFSSISLFGIGYGFNYYNLMLISIILLCTNNILYAFESTGKRIVFLLFNISFFTFLLGQWFFEMLNGEEWWIRFPSDIVVHTLLSLFISLLFIYLGTNFAERIDRKKNINYELTKKNKYLIYIRKVSEIMFYITYIFAFITILEVVVFVQQNGYLAIYTIFSSQIPPLFKKISLTCATFFYIYLATLPKKNKSKKIIILWLVYLGANLLAGSRGFFVVGLFTIFAYGIFRDKCLQDTDEMWIGTAEKRIIILSLPFLIAFLSAYNSIRVGINVENFSVMNEIINFFKAQGGSVQVISYSKFYENFLPTTNSSYVFGPISKYFTVGSFASFFTGLTPITDKLDVALYGNNLGATITYLVMPQYYFAGVGMGTQYIAELYADFGYIGVAIFNFVVGMVIYFLLSVAYKKWWLFAIGLLTCFAIFRMPRDFALTWIGVWYALPTWLPIIFSGIVAKALYNSKNRFIKKAY